MVFVWHCVSVWYWAETIYQCRENGCILARWTDTCYSERMRNERDKHRAETHDKHSDVFLFLKKKKKDPFKLWVCLLLSLSGPCSYSLSGSKTHNPSLNFSLLLTHSAVLNCCIRKAETLFFDSVPCTTLQFSSMSAVNTDTIKLQLSMSTAVWMWSTSIYPYLLMYVQMNSSPVIVFYSLQDKWSLKENPCLDPLCLEWLFVG